MNSYYENYEFSSHDGWTNSIDYNEPSHLAVVAIALVSALIIAIYLCTKCAQLSYRICLSVVFWLVGLINLGLRKCVNWFWRLLFSSEEFRRGVDSFWITGRTYGSEVMNEGITRSELLLTSGLSDGRPGGLINYAVTVVEDKFHDTLPRVAEALSQEVQKSVPMSDVYGMINQAASAVEEKFYDALPRITDAVSQEVRKSVPMAGVFGAVQSVASVPKRVAQQVYKQSTDFAELLSTITSVISVAGGAAGLGMLIAAISSKLKDIRPQSLNAEARRVSSIDYLGSTALLVASAAVFTRSIPMLFEDITKFAPLVGSLSSVFGKLDKLERLRPTQCEKHPHRAHIVYDVRVIAPTGVVPASSDAETDQTDEPRESSDDNTSPASSPDSEGENLNKILCDACALRVPARQVTADTPNGIQVTGLYREYCPNECCSGFTSNLLCVACADNLTSMANTMFTREGYMGTCACPGYDNCTKCSYVDSDLYKMARIFTKPLAVLLTLYFAYSYRTYSADLIKKIYGRVMEQIRGLRPAPPVEGGPVAEAVSNKTAEAISQADDAVVEFDDEQSSDDSDGDQAPVKQPIKGSFRIGDDLHPVSRAVRRAVNYIDDKIDPDGVMRADRLAKTKTGQAYNEEGLYVEAKGKRRPHNFSHVYLSGPGQKKPGDYDEYETEHDRASAIRKPKQRHMDDDEEDREDLYAEALVKSEGDRLRVIEENASLKRELEKLRIEAATSAAIAEERKRVSFSLPLSSDGGKSLPAKKKKAKKVAAKSPLRAAPSSGKKLNGEAVGYTLDMKKSKSGFIVDDDGNTIGQYVRIKDAEGTIHNVTLNHVAVAAGDLVRVLKKFDSKKYVAHPVQLGDMTIKDCVVTFEFTGKVASYPTVLTASKVSLGDIALHLSVITGSSNACRVLSLPEYPGLYAMKSSTEEGDSGSPVFVGPEQATFLGGLHGGSAAGDNFFFPIPEDFILRARN